jgi:protein TonB
MTSRAHTDPANDRLKRRFEDILGVSLIAAVGVHFLIFQMWPEMTAEVLGRDVADEVTVIQLDDIPLPVAPEALLRPAAPIISTDAPVDATIPDVGWREVAELPPPPPPPADDAGADRRPFVVYDVAPRLTNPEDFERALQRAYPTALRDAGIGGTVTLQIFIDENGRALEARVVGGSGYARLDEVAVGLIDVMRFSPALNRDRRVPVWVEIPIAFRTRDG